MRWSRIVAAPVVLLASAASATATVRQHAAAAQYEVKMPHSHSAQTAAPEQQQQQQSVAAYNPYNDTDFLKDLKRNVYRAPSQERREEEARNRRHRVRQRRTRARNTLASLSQQADNPNEPPQANDESSSGHKKPKGKVHRLTQEEIQNVQRKTSWFGSDSLSYNAAMDNLADPAGDYDKWAQAYRYLGAFIDCDHTTSEGSGDNGGGDDEDGGACSRWMMWASYINPNYQGYEYDEYFGEEPMSTLDCHNPDTEWQLIGVYRQEFYQFIEQISKHLWAIDDYEYVVARAGLLYMGEDDCFEVGNDQDGNSIRAGIAPQANGRFEMGLYSDEYCLEVDESLGTYDDYGGQTDVDLGSGDGDGDGDESEDLYEWWYAAQEYTLTDLNAVYEEYTYCTPCMDYPTYQDGYFIGDYGTDDDDLINQCWKFHSHDSFICEAECIAMGHSQGSINQVLYGDQVFGQAMSNSGYSTEGSRSKAEVLVESSWSRIMANAFLTFSFLLFVATFLAFAVARRSRYRESRSSKSRRLLDDTHDEGGGHRSVRSRRSRSRKKKRGSSSNASQHGRRSGSRNKEDEGDGLFRTSQTADNDQGSERRSSRNHRSKSRSKRSRSSNKDSKKRPSGSETRSKSKSKDRAGSKDRGGTSNGDPPSRSSKARSNREDNF